jgi:hypothetical protein
MSAVAIASSGITVTVAATYILQAESARRLRAGIATVSYWATGRRYYDRAKRIVADTFSNFFQGAA